MEIILNAFIDFISRSGSAKMTLARTIHSYLDVPQEVGKDYYYQSFISGIQAFHAEGSSKKDLLQMMEGLPNNKKDSYRELIAGYMKFLGKTPNSSFEISSSIWKHGDIEVPILPALGLELDGRKYIVLMHLKADKPTKDWLAIALTMMDSTLNKEDATCAVLDVRNSKLYPFEEEMKQLSPLLEGEATSLEIILGSMKVSAVEEENK